MKVFFCLVSRLKIKYGIGFFRAISIRVNCAFKSNLPILPSRGVCFSKEILVIHLNAPRGAIKRYVEAIESLSFVLGTIKIQPENESSC